MRETQRIRVLRIIDRLNVGGPAIHAVLATQGLDKARFETTLVTGSVEPGEADMSYLARERGVELVVIPSLGRELRPLRDARTFLALLAVVRRTRPDVVHTHKAKAGALGRLAALACRVPVRVHTFHGHVFHGYFGPARTRAFVAIERALGRLSTRLIALSQGLADELSARYAVAPRSRFAIVPLGLDLAPFASATGTLRAELGLPPERKLVGIVGRMVPVKDHHTFLAAGARLVARRADVDLVAVGGGELEPELRAAAGRLGLDGRIHFLGWRRDLPGIYADLDVVALSSVNEGTPVTLIEAMSAGVPVVATAVGGVPDLLRHGARGGLVPPGDPEALAAAIERALSPEARARAQALQGEIIEAYGAGRLCRDLESLYEALLDRRPS